MELAFWNEAINGKSESNQLLGMLLGIGKNTKQHLAFGGFRNFRTGRCWGISRGILSQGITKIYDLNSKSRIQRTVQQSMAIISRPYLYIQSPWMSQSYQKSDFVLLEHPQDQKQCLILLLNVCKCF